MKHIVSSLIFLVLSSSPMFAEEIGLDQLQGQWINTNYLEKLHKMRSHYRAICEIPAFYISQEDNIYKWLIVLGFHEGMRYNVVDLTCSDPNTYELVFYEHQDSGRISENDRFFFPEGLTGNEIQWIFDPIYLHMKGEQKISFVRLKPPLADYINFVLLVGTYTDQNGRTFTFHQSGKAEWPDKSFSYKVSLDSFLSAMSWCEYFYVIGEKDEEGQRIRYPFKWLNNKLYIYNTYNDPDGSDSLQPQKEPTYILAPQ